MTAILSPCGLYRFELERDVQLDGIVTALFGVNPSWAGATSDDPTIRKDIGFAKVHGWRQIIKGNVFPFRSDDVRALRGVTDHRLEENAEHIRAIAARADILVPCWGRTDKVPPQLRYAFDVLMDALVSSGKPVMHFGLTKGGDPKHPLMLGYDTPLIAWGADAS